MASSVTDRIKSAAQTVANRAETVVGDDAREAARRVKKAVHSYGNDYRFFVKGERGSSSKSSPNRTPARKSGR